MNRLRDEDIAKAVGSYREFADVPKYARVVPLEKVRENDYSLSVARYVDVFEEEEPMDVSQVWSEVKRLDSGRQTIESKLGSYLRELGYDN
jgi:type I restriction enzyme M protein